MNDYEKELEIAVASAHHAGKIAKSFLKCGFETEFKGGDCQNPVTDADFAVDKYLRETLTSAFPNYGWLSEETTDNKDRLNCKKAWVVDPIDGTKAFIKGIPGFTISIALVDNGEPVLGVVYNPLKDQMFSACKGQVGTINGKLFRPLEERLLEIEKALCLTSSTETELGLWDEFYDKINLEPIPSVAYKLALVAAGKADITASIKPKQEWDVAAGHALLNSIGLKFTELDGNERKYNQSMQVKLNGIIASPDCMYEQLFNMLPKKVVREDY